MASTARTVKRKPPVRVVDNGDFEPLHLTTKRPENRAPEERAVLFTLDDREFTIPKRFPPNLGLRVIRTQRRQGLDVAAAELLEEVIGDEAYDALVNYPDLEPEHLEQLMQIVVKLAMGALDVPKGRSASA
jgi:hypothetical protein